ncbi:MAG TPA: beta-L-arabinofuranosidase domain-containing protein [Armatimonadota bacterium]|jgi:hypothetical protein
MICRKQISVMLCLLLAAGIALGAIEEQGHLQLDELPGARWKFGGFPGERINADVENWLLVAPEKNPGLTGMFAQRDAGGVPNIMPWAGEFAGKYLISAVQALRMSDDPNLRKTVQGVVDRLCQLQAEDGYLGPWPKRERLLGHWDLWGHYHVLVGLLMWAEQTGDLKSLRAAEKIGDLVCNTFLDTKVRVKDTGSPEMNMTILTGMARLYRTTGNPRYLRMAQEVLKDFESGGDYYRTGMAGVEFYRTHRPRWESLHCLQGLAELYRITGDATFRQAFLHHWASIRRYENRNTGAFSSGEQACGNSFTNEPIETCCVIAWQEVMLDALKLTGDATIADDLELATFNAVFGAQHPSGAWCTYNTPVNGARGPSHIQIGFQNRPDTPLLNCCSVNAPRGYGILSEWGIMRSAYGLAVNYYGPLQATVMLEDGTPVTVTEDTTYPVGSTINITITPGTPKVFTLALRIPAWAEQMRVTVAGKPVAGIVPGQYMQIKRKWGKGDRLTVRLEQPLRYETGDLQQMGKVALYRGPLLLTSDSRLNTKIDPTVDLARLHSATIVTPDATVLQAVGSYRPWLIVDMPTTDGQRVRLMDFASAGATTLEGKVISTYASWLPAASARPPRPVAAEPVDNAHIGPGPLVFNWRAMRSQISKNSNITVVIAESPTFAKPVLTYGNSPAALLCVPPEITRTLRPGVAYYWKLVARNAVGQAESIAPYKRFFIDPQAPALPLPASTAIPDTLYGERNSDRMLVSAPLRGNVTPDYGSMVMAKGWEPATGPDGVPGNAIQLNGQDSQVKFAIASFPYERYAVSLWMCITALPEGHIGQLFSAWTRAYDDPLRLVVDRGQLYGRVEAGSMFTTQGVPITVGTWYHVVAVRANETLTLYLNGKACASTHVAPIYSEAMTFAVGGNPNYGGNECLAAKVRDVKFYARDLSTEEIAQLFTLGAGKANTKMPND